MEREGWLALLSESMGKAAVADQAAEEVGAALGGGDARLLRVTL